MATVGGVPIEPGASQTPTSPMGAPKPRPRPSPGRAQAPGPRPRRARANVGALMALVTRQRPAPSSGRPRDLPDGSHGGHSPVPLSQRLATRRQRSGTSGERGLQLAGALRRNWSDQPWSDRPGGLQDLLTALRSSLPGERFREQDPGSIGGIGPWLPLSGPRRPDWPTPSRSRRSPRTLGISARPTPGRLRRPRRQPAGRLVGVGVTLAPEEGFEPPTRRLTAACSTTELLRKGEGTNR